MRKLLLYSLLGVFEFYSRFTAKWAICPFVKMPVMKRARSWSLALIVWLTIVVRSFSERIG